MNTNQEFLNLEAERDALIRAVADHVTVRAERREQLQALAAVIQQLRDGITTCIAYKATPSSELLKIGYDTSAKILARRDASIRQEMLDLFRMKHRDYANEIERELLAAELLKGLEKEHGNQT